MNTRTRFLQFCFIMILTISCTRQSNENADVDTADSLSSDIIDAKLPYLYADFAGYFLESDEFFVILNLKTGVSLDVTDELAAATDSVIYETEDYVSRKRLPQALGTKYFDLPSDTLYMFDWDHNFVSMATLVRAEYSESPIESQFVAVYAPQDAITQKEQKFYALNFKPGSRKAKQYRLINDTELTEKLAAQKSLAPDSLWNAEHLRLQDTDTVLSLLSYVDSSMNTFSYLALSDDKGATMLHELRDADYVMNEMLPIPYNYGGFPLLLIAITIPDTDFVDYVPAYYNGKQYQLSIDNKVPLSK